MELLAFLTLVFCAALLLAVGRSDHSSSPTIIVNNGSGHGTGQGVSLVLLLILITMIALGGQSTGDKGVSSSAAAPSETEYAIWMDQDV